MERARSDRVVSAWVRYFLQCEAAMDITDTRKTLRVENADISDSRFSNARLASSSFEDVDLRRSTFANANITSATFVDVNLSNVVIKNANLAGMTIDDVLVSDLIRAYENRAK